MLSIPPTIRRGFVACRVARGLAARDRRLSRAFSLIETTLAIGIVAFAFVAILGLMPIGLTSFRKAMDISTSSRIVQQVTAELQQGASFLAKPPMMYFDEQGDRMTAATNPDGDRALYFVNMVVEPSTTLPGGVSPDLATVTVEIAKNSGGETPARDPATSAFADQPGLQVWRYPVLLATRNL